MASKFPAERDEKVELRATKGHDMTWSCDIHGEPIKFYCKEHKIPICHPCATKDHDQKPCELDDIEDVILERRRKLDDKQHDIEKTKKQLKTLDSKIESIATFSSNHFLSLNDEVKVTSEDKLKSVKDKEGDNIRSINKKADKEIRIINKRRETLIKSYNEETEQQKLIIKESHEKVLSETKEICDMFSKKITYLASKNQHAINAMENDDAKIKRIKQEDKTLVNEGLQVLASLDDNLSLNVHKDVSDCLDRIQREVQKVMFVEGEVRGEIYGKWELVKSIHISSNVKSPLVCGLISDDEICEVDLNTNATYVTNINSQHTEKVIEGGNTVYLITSCAPIDSNILVCGKRKKGLPGFSLDDCITLYDRQWKAIRDIGIPIGNTSSYMTNVYVDVDGDGMILAAQEDPDQPNIYVINPADGKIENTITMQGEMDGKIMGQIHALSSGDIVVKTENKYTVISRSGEEKAVIHHAEWGGSWLRVDKLTDTLYITYQDKGRRTNLVVDQVSCDGIIQARRILEYKRSDKGYYFFSPCLLSPSGNLVACNGDWLFECKKRLIV